MVDELIKYFMQNVTLAETFTNILADFLEEDATTYSIEPVPVEPVLKSYTDGSSLNQYVFQFSSREFYDNSKVQNINNLGFYDEFKEQIEYNNKHKILPNIDGIQSIECLSYGTIQSEEDGKAKYAIQMRIIYLKEVENEQRKNSY